MKPKAFWGEVVAHAKQHQADPILAYMNLMLMRARAKGIPVRRDDFQRHGHGLPLFEGVEDWFDRINAYGKARGVNVEHYIVSSGNEEIVAGTSIAGKFTRVYASKFLYDEDGEAVWPALAINYTTKTQFLFRINKGMLDPAEDVNDHMPPELRPIPFQNMIYVGDGPTDVPCFTVMKQNGGRAIAVYNPADATRASFKKCYQLTAHADRVRHIAPADYRPGSHLRLLLEEMVAEIADTIVGRRRADIAAATVRAPKH